MLKLRKAGVVLTGITVAALVLTGCTGGGGGGGTKSSGGGEEAVSDANLPGTGWDRAERDAIKDGGTLTIPVDQPTTNFNIYHVDSGTVDDNLISGLFYPNFVKFKEDGTWEPNTDYVESMELKSEDPQVVEIKINPDAVWNDGTPITVADIAANWQAQNGTNEAYQVISTNVWKDIASVEAGTDERDVLVTFAAKNADWPSIFGALLPASVASTPEAFNTAWATAPTMSGGPFQIAKYDVAGQVLTFERNPKWWGEPAKLDSVIFKVVSRAGLAQAFGNSEIDLTNLFGSADNYETAKGRSDAKIERSLGTTYRHVTLNGTGPVLSDVNVRKAFAMSLNREVIAQSRLAPVESPVNTLGNLVYLPGQQGYEDHASDVYGYDVEGAKKMLEDAGWTGDDVREKNGQPLTVRFVIPSDNPASAEVAQQVQAQTAETGFDVQIDTVPTDDFFTEYITQEAKDFDATYFAWQGTPFPVSSVESIYYPVDSGQNFSGITDESLGDDFLAANAELDPDKRVDLANAIDKKLINLAGTIPLFFEPYAWAVKDGLVNYGPSQFEVSSVQWQNVGWAAE
jgi:peptide/nickel transport system substrate-binding protein